MAEDASSTSLQFLRELSEAMEQVRSRVAPSFGPCGSDAMLLSSVGKLLVTNSGNAILQSMAENKNPLIAYILRMLTLHTNVAGDGSSTVVLLLDAAVQTACKFLNESSSYPTAQLHASLTFSSLSTADPPHHKSLLRLRRRKLLRALESIEQHWIGNLALERWILTTKASAIPASSALSHVQQTVAQLVRAFLGNKLSPNAVATLGAALTQLIFSSRRTPTQSLSVVCRALLADFPFVLSSQLPLAESKPMHGFLLSGPNAKLARRNMKPILENASMLLLHCDLFHPRSDAETVAHISILTRSNEESLAFLQESEKIVKKWIERFKREGVSLIISTYNMSDVTLTLLAAAGITVVHSLDSYDTRRIAKYAGVTPVTNLEHFETASRLPVVHVEAFAQVTVGSQLMIHLEILPKDIGPNTSTPVDQAAVDRALIKGHTMLLCGASEAMCKQYELMLTRCLRFLTDWATPYASLETSGESSAQLQQNQNVFVVGGGGSVELSLQMFCEEQSQLPFHTEAHRTHPLLPPGCFSEASVRSADFSASFRVLSEAFSSPLKQLLQNSNPSAVAISSSSSPSLPSNASVPFERQRSVAWLEILGELRTLRDHLPMMKNMAFAAVNVMNAPAYAPLHLQIKQKGTGLKEVQEMITQQSAVAAAELKLQSLLPLNFKLHDALQSSLNQPIFDSPHCRVQIVSSFISTLTALLRVNYCVRIKKHPASSPNSLSALNSSPSGKFSTSRRIRQRDAWNVDEEEEIQDGLDTNSSSSDND